MTNWKREVALAAAGLLVGSIALGLLPEINSSNDVVNALNNPVVQLLLITAIVYGGLTSGLGWLTRVLSKDDNRGPVMPYSGRKPDTGTIVGEIRYEGVNWPFAWGESRGTYHGWADRPNCPECGNGLDSDRTRHRIRSDKLIWDCPACGFSAERRNVTDQRESVQKIVEQEGDRIIRGLVATENSEVESMIEEIEKKATGDGEEVELSFLDPNLGLDTDGLEAVEESINEVVDFDELEDGNKVLVLDHLLRMDVGPRNQYDVLWWQGDKRSVKRATSRRV